LLRIKTTQRVCVLMDIHSNIDYSIHEEPPFVCGVYPLVSSMILIRD